MKWVVILIIGVLEINAQNFNRYQALQNINKLTTTDSPNNFEVSSAQNDEEPDYLPASVISKSFRNSAYGIGHSYGFHSLGKTLSNNNIISGPVPNITEGCDGLTGLWCFDCYTFVYCNLTDAPVFVNTCTSKAPYCIDGSCSTTPSTECEATTNFVCTGKGFFPDPGNCSIGYYCAEGVSAPEMIYDCPARYAFNPIMGICERKSHCQTVNCRNHANGFVAYPRYSGYYAYCNEVAENTYTVLTFKCADAENMTFNPVTLECKYNCRSEGSFPDVNDNTKYYFCYRQNGAWRFMHLDCPGTAPSKLQFIDGRCQIPAN